MPFIFMFTKSIQIDNQMLMFIMIKDLSTYFSGMYTKVLILISNIYESNPYMVLHWSKINVCYIKFHCNMNP